MKVEAIAASGLLAAASAARIHAHNIVNSATPDHERTEPVFQSLGGLGGAGVTVIAHNVGGGAADLIRDIAGLKLAAQQYEASATLMRTAESLSAHLLQTFA